VIVSQNTLPEFMSVTDNCTYRFVWTTLAACPQAVQPVYGENCAVTDPTTSKIITLCSLSSSRGLFLNGRCHFHERPPCWRLTHGKHFSLDVPGSLPGRHWQVEWPKTWNYPWSTPTCLKFWLCSVD